MENVVKSDDFTVKFGKLSEQNQKYILAIQQALLYAQAVEKEEKKQMKYKSFSKETKDEF
ncbi:MAG: hypothetical protein HFI76_08535 [Lachnospiraceae bacterium]|nr:hypothetical protein [Lachnospiraceae bacterium]